MVFQVEKRLYKMEFTDLCINLYELKTVKDRESKNYGEIRDELIGYYQSFDSIYKTIMLRHLSSRNARIKSFEDILREVNKVTQVLEGLLIKQ